MVHADLSLWTPLLTEEARRQAWVRKPAVKLGCNEAAAAVTAVQTITTFVGALTPFRMPSLLNPNFITHDPDGTMFEARGGGEMRYWRRRGPQRRHQGNDRRKASGSDPSRPQSNGIEAMSAPSVATPQAQVPL